jgi:hypothetical protein
MALLQRFRADPAMLQCCRQHALAAAARYDREALAMRMLASLEGIAGANRTRSQGR